MGGEDDGLYFGSVKPWLGSMQPPSNFDPSTLDPGLPNVELQLDYAYGYRSRDCRDNVHWVDCPKTLVYHTACVCVLLDLETKTQRFYRSHEDDILCLTYCPTRRLAASGGLGPRSKAPVFIWSVDDMSTRQTLIGQMEYGVVSVAFSPDGKRTFAVDISSAHRVAVFDTDSGTMLASSNGDSNRIIHLAPDCTTNRDSHKSFVSVGVSHIKFWTREADKLVGKKATGADVSSQTMVCVASNDDFVFVGNVSGSVYIFSDCVIVNQLAAHSKFVGALYADGPLLYSGSRDGDIKVWDVTGRGDQVALNERAGGYNLNPANYLSDPKRLVKDDKKRPCNGPRALSVRDGKVAVGTHLGCVYYLPSEFEPPQVLVEGHFEMNPGDMPELWGMDVHPSEALFCTACDDATLRLWSIELGTQILMAHVSFPSRCCCYNTDGTMIAVGHSNGAFSVWDSMTLTPIIPFTRKRERPVVCCAFSPDGRFLALSMQQANVVDIYYAKKDFEYVGTCDTVSCYAKQMDWNRTSTKIRCCTSSFEIITFVIPACENQRGTENNNELWHTTTALVGWGNTGIWEGCNDGSDVNSFVLSHSGRLCAAAYDFSQVRLFNYPSITQVVGTNGKHTYPRNRMYRGHSSHVTVVRFSQDDKYVLTTGGMDLSILRWRVVPVASKAANAPPSPKKTAETKAEEILQSVAQGTIRELGRARRLFQFNEEDEKATQQDPAHRARVTPMDQGGTSSQQPNLGSTRRSASASQRKFRPVTPAYLNNIESRLTQTTASMEEKARHGRLQRAHVLKMEENKTRFNRF